MKTIHEIDHNKFTLMSLQIRIKSQGNKNNDDS